MAKITIIMEDVGSSVSLDMQIANMEMAGSPATPAMTLAMATRAMFENGMLAEAAGRALQGLARTEIPSECILNYYKKGQEDE